MGRLLIYPKVMADIMDIDGFCWLMPVAFGWWMSTVNGLVGWCEHGIRNAFLSTRLYPDEGEIEPGRERFYYEATPDH